MGGCCCSPDEAPPHQKIIVETSDEDVEYTREPTAVTERSTTNIGAPVESETGVDDYREKEQGGVDSEGQEKVEQEKVEQEKVEQEKVEQEKVEQEKVEQEQRESDESPQSTRPTLLVPQYSAGGPKGTSTEKIEDPFVPPDIGNAIYLLYKESDRGSIKVQYARETKDVDGRVVGSGKLTKEVQKFKYKAGTLVATNIWAKPDSFYEGMAHFVKDCGQQECEITFYPLPPDFPPFYVAYHLQDDNIQLQCGGSGSFNEFPKVTSAAVCSPLIIDNVNTKRKIDAVIFNAQFVNRSTGFLIDFMVR